MNAIIGQFRNRRGNLVHMVQVDAETINFVCEHADDSNLRRSTNGDTGEMSMLDLPDGPCISVGEVLAENLQITKINSYEATVRVGDEVPILTVSVGFGPGVTACTM